MIEILIAVIMGTLAWYILHGYLYFKTKRFIKSLKIGDKLARKSDIIKRLEINQPEFLPPIPMSDLDNYTIEKIGKKCVLVGYTGISGRERQREIDYDVITIYEVIK